MSRPGRLGKPERFCAGCGRAGCAGCLPKLDPPRYCGRCGAWLATTVTPTGWTAKCRRCGPIR